MGTGLRRFSPREFLEMSPVKGSVRAVVVADLGCGWWVNCLSITQKKRETIVPYGFTNQG